MSVTVPAIDSRAAPRETSAVDRNIDDLDVPTWFSMLAISATLRTAMLHPLNIALARQRVENGLATRSRSIILEMYRAGGVRRVYRGFGAMLGGNVLGEVLYLMILEKVRNWLQGGDHTWLPRPIRDALAGIAGDFAAFVATTPLSVVATRQMTAGFGMAQSNDYRSAARTVSNLWASSGAGPFGRLVGLYPGALASIVMIPAAGVWWALYGQAKAVLYGAAQQISILQGHHSTTGSAAHHHITTAGAHPLSAVQVLASSNWFVSSTDNPVINGAAGVTASILTTLIYNPVTVVRTRLVALPSADRALAALRNCTVELWRQEGIRGFYRGARTNVLTSVLEGLLFSLSYEITKLSSDKFLLDAVQDGA